jgi:putative FmdB family regulatory protein
MPIYEYACRSCGRRIEVLHGIHAEGPTTCEVCSGTMTKMVSVPAIVFKGSGWAKKDAHAQSTARAAGGDGTRADAPAAADSTATSEPASAPGEGKPEGGQRRESGSTAVPARESKGDSSTRGSSSASGRSSSGKRGGAR